MRELARLAKLDEESAPTQVWYESLRESHGIRTSNLDSVISSNSSHESDSWMPPRAPDKDKRMAHLRKHVITPKTEEIRASIQAPAL